MNDDRFLRSIKDLEKVGGKVGANTENIHPITKWLLRTVFDNLYAEDDEQLVVQIGESEETLSMIEYKQFQYDLISIGYPKDEVCRGMFDEDPASDNMCRCFKV